jgi:two-component sensor histidine kinase/integral membrane sensor domain MASE1
LNAAQSRSAEGDAPTRRWLRYIGQLAGVAAIYFVVAKLGLALASVHPNATPIWPATGFALAALLLFGYRIWPAIFVAAFVANITTAGSTFTSTAIAAGNTLESVVGSFLINRWSNGIKTFDTPLGVAKFALISFAPSTMISATIGVASLSLDGYAAWPHFPSIWLTWWIGDLAGALVVAPIIVLWSTSSSVRLLRRPEAVELAGVITLSIAVGLIAFSPVLEQTTYRGALAFLVILPLMWSALRGGQRDTATVVFVVSCFAVWGAVSNSGPFARTNINESFLLFLAFMISISVPSLALSADLTARRRQEEQRLRAEEQRTLLLREMSHRIKNLFAVMSAMVALSARYARTPQELAKSVQERLGALNRAHELTRTGLIGTAHHPVEDTTLHALIRTIFAPYVAGRGKDEEGLVLTGCDVPIDRNAITNVALVLHELATNAAKYGALSVPEGVVHVDCSEASGQLSLRWKELGGPLTNGTPSGEGFGGSLTQRIIKDQFGGQLSRTWEREGLIVRLSVPLDRLKS